MKYGGHITIANCIIRIVYGAKVWGFRLGCLDGPCIWMRTLSLCGGSYSIGGRVAQLVEHLAHIGKVPRIDRCIFICFPFLHFWHSADPEQWSNNRLVISFKVAKTKNEGRYVTDRARQFAGKLSRIECPASIGKVPGLTATFFLILLHFQERTGLTRD